MDKSRILVTDHAAARMRERFPGIGGLPLIRDEVWEAITENRFSKRVPEWACKPENLNMRRQKVTFAWPASEKRCYVVSKARARDTNVLRVITVLARVSEAALERREGYKRMKDERGK